MIDGKKIIVIDDDPQVGTVLSKLLSEKGAVVTTADSFDSGVAAMKNEMPDLAVVDVMMPGKSGLELVKEVQTWPKPHPFFFVLTNSINALHIAEAMEANITMFVQKADHDPHEIADMIARHFEVAKDQ